eukprot:scaffold65611_cov18-Tisochrysis_lutea.AAC.1
MFSLFFGQSPSRTETARGRLERRRWRGPSHRERCKLLRLEPASRHRLELVQALPAEHRTPAWWRAG